VLFFDLFPTNSFLEVFVEGVSEERLRKLSEEEFNETSETVYVGRLQLRDSLSNV